MITDIDKRRRDLARRQIELDRNVDIFYYTLLTTCTVGVIVGLIIRIIEEIR